MHKMLPIGIESFSELRNDNFYYVDKTGMIEDLLTARSKVWLFTRPRRFGKTLNMDMLQSFFELGQSKELFEGLFISNNVDLCDRYQASFPVISISLKSIDGASFEKSVEMLEFIIHEEMLRHAELLSSDKLG